MKDFKDKVAVITGAASGIGFGLAERSAKEGMKVVLADVEESALKQAEQRIKEMGVDTLAVRTDVSEAKDVESLAEKTVKTFGGVHLLCNNAGVSGGVTVWESTLADWQWVLGVNLWGVIHGVHSFIPVMLAQDNECHIVNTASPAGLVTIPSMAPYTVSKHGIVALSEMLYKQLKEKGLKIGVTVLCPGSVRTRLDESDRNRPVKFINKPETVTEEYNKSVQTFTSRARQVVESGIAPQEVADLVFNAIRNNMFYLFPNAVRLDQIIKTRMEDIIQERNPTTMNPR